MDISPATDHTHTNAHTPYLFKFGTTASLSPYHLYYVIIVCHSEQVNFRLRLTNDFRVSNFCHALDNFDFSAIVNCDDVENAMVLL